MGDSISLPPSPVATVPSLPWNRLRNAAYFRTLVQQWKSRNAFFRLLWSVTAVYTSNVNVLLSLTLDNHPSTRRHSTMFSSVRGFTVGDFILFTHKTNMHPYIQLGVREHAHMCPVFYGRSKNYDDIQRRYRRNPVANGSPQQGKVSTMSDIHPP
jgi:hypothetical protein